MKLIDKTLRWWRVNLALKFTPKNIDSAFDIGCDDGYLLQRLANRLTVLEGCDPRLNQYQLNPKFNCSMGFFPAVIDNGCHDRKYDVIYALAVFEHFNQNDLHKSSLIVSEMLKDNGRLIVSVPHPFVDRILDVLFFLKLIDGQALEEHHGLNPKLLIEILQSHLLLKRIKYFQLGLNNIMIFQKKINY
jgi:2-polyprenyl-3-methyl-5-hydroxy-6-metoxy-1,4-benzoquinol methylase